MKTLLFAFMLLASLQSNGQKKDTMDERSKYWSVLDNSAKRNKPIFSSSGDMLISSLSVYQYKSDTLYIKRPDMIRFIKIGDRVYRIESPMLTEVTPTAIFISNSIPVLGPNVLPNRYNWPQ